MTFAIVFGTFWILLVSSSIAVSIRRRRRLRCLQGELADQSAILKKLDVSDLPAGGWTPGVYERSFSYSESSMRVCLLRSEGENIVIRMGPDSEDLSLPAEHFRRSRPFNNWELTYNPQRAGMGPWFSILLSREQVESFEQIPWRSRLYELWRRRST